MKLLIVNTVPAHGPAPVLVFLPLGVEIGLIFWSMGTNFRVTHTSEFKNFIIGLVSDI